MTSFAKVILVGAGPGDPNLLTLAGADALAHADVVVYDYLANPELLKLCPPAAEKIYVGKSGAQHTKTQDQINALLLDKAREHGNKTGASIVRLKGGDPYVFGRGGEEGEFLHAHHVPFEVVPGITAGIAAPAYAGIPVTHRDLTSTITLITGHEREGPDADAANSRVDYDALAKLGRTGGTLVFYMGIKCLPTIISRLTAAGLDPSTPAAVIRWGTRADQQTVTAPLQTLVETVTAAGLTAPAITIVGPVVTLRDTLNWFESRPLFGHTIIVTRTRQQASDLASQLTALGARVLEAPTIEITPPPEDQWDAIDRTLQQIPAYDWVVFTSPNGVRAAWQRLRHLTFDARHFGASHVAAIGPATADALESIGIVPDLLPEKFVGEQLAAALRQHLGDAEIRGQRFLLLRADIARPVLRDELLKLGARVDDLPIYQTLRPASLPDDLQSFLAQPHAPHKHWVTFTSASTAENLWHMLTESQRTRIAAMRRLSIGPITSAALQNLGGGQWKPTLESPIHTIAGMIETITRNTTVSH